MQEPAVSVPPVFSSVRVHLVKFKSEEGKLRALASCLIGATIMLTGIRVIEGRNGLFISMPQRKTAEGVYTDIAFPISKDAREKLQKVILEEFERAMLSLTPKAA